MTLPRAIGCWRRGGIIEISFAVWMKRRRGGVFGAAALRAAHESLSRGRAPRESECLATGGSVRPSISSFGGAYCALQFDGGC
jgi:hypothetical protein